MHTPHDSHSDTTVDRVQRENKQCLCDKSIQWQQKQQSRAEQYVYVTADDEVSSGAAGSRFVGSHARVVARVFAAHARYRQSAGILVFCNLNA